MFANDVQLTGRRGSIRFARGSKELEQWFRDVPDEFSSHRIIHSSWKAGDGHNGKLDFIVAYQSPAQDGTVSGSIISYETIISFADDRPRFLSLDKTPILPNPRMQYSPTWAEHRVLGFVHAVLGRQIACQSAAEALSTGASANSRVDVWAPVPELSSEIDAFLTIGTPEGNLLGAEWRFQDDGDSDFPAPLRIEPLRRMTTRGEEANDVSRRIF
ncbi:hypothetical protein J2790_003887 [Paenarthrobacter nicotinovorans]|uniref:hypothetical protein n=1 Tax=Arthrobacter sp. UNCCL28 TaxID=1502752 RepID=UPI00111412C8|nr:hypothetical protein [Arthrobacter sp. UNCCL28]MDR6438720.1 hypothetical protein [Paenarthrobacter nicotinovorans]